MNIYFNNEKHHIQIWNHAASSFDDEKAKGVIFYCDDEEFKQLDELFNAKLADLPEYFKIELIDSDSEDLKEYKNSHPELKVEDY
ncbi:hypothetical protein J6W91_00030 [Candidatus Saccharibacteria bacterium]|nr:hypothetical protein [Candidatus Saccharibacteria bacterium]